MVQVSKVSVQDFLYPDRHRRLYSRFEVYLPIEQMPGFIRLLAEGKTADEIQAALGVPYRGDVLFAILLAYLTKRDGLMNLALAGLPDIDPVVPDELRAGLPSFEDDWRRRNEHPADARLH